MRVHIDPPIDQWPLPPRSRTGAVRPVVATGHQPGFWHPGILAKYITADRFAAAAGADVVQVVADQDTGWAERIDVPLARDDVLSDEPLTLGPYRTIDIPLAAKPRIEPYWALFCLKQFTATHGAELVAEVSPLKRAWASERTWRDVWAQWTCRGYEDPSPRDTGLSKQLTRIIGKLSRRWVERRIPALFASQLMQSRPGRALLDWMTSDPSECVRHYNNAAAAHPDAGLTTLRQERGRVELPLWLIEAGKPRGRVFARRIGGQWKLDLPKQSMTVSRLAPRAIVLTALMRGSFCDLFIHGTGGAVYDRVTEDWWRNWTGEDLAPRVTVTADVTLDFDAPVADPAERDRAAWYAHHLPHNIDRFAPAESVDAALVARKRDLLAHMNDDDDRARRAAAFRELKRINDQLAAAQPQLLTEAQQRLDRAALGVRNRQIALKRDWCFALYPPQKLDELKRAIEGQVNAAFPHREAAKRP